MKGVAGRFRGRDYICGFRGCGLGFWGLDARIRL